MEGISAHEPHPKKDESHTERPNPDETHEERPNPFVGKEHLSALRKAIAIAIASGFVVSSQPPAEAAPVTKPTDELRQTLTKKEMDALRERNQIFDARYKGQRDTKLEKKRPGLSMGLDDIEDSVRKQMEERSAEVADEVGRFVENTRRMGNQWGDMRDELLKGTVRYHGLETEEDTDAFRSLLDIFTISHEVGATYPKLEDLTTAFVQNPDVQTAGRIQDLNERMRVFFSLPKEVQDHAMAESVRRNDKQQPQTPSYPYFLEA
ncbi:hypothetical protein A2765_04895 [Candidatus Kaiserbacteria bacterium RIFCSPHIGHO2_01_FULL_56_24]|uniref:Uncharacterized protein n=1 Tax=Candidatus Kaiserbacteria bacterium RIFCSPHIGHO2_01_FULL_56_24 TaxID=1798487 RepID=A0A1F6DEZ0_9BACT|nr:MAG: hypothetical protein A2765_04895 [Candidatus Kaiserbacteria bacterium RIFCSPHIGHO2_01_FULL_56_24]